MKKLLSVCALVGFGTVVSNAEAQVALRGADSLENVAREVIAACVNTSGLPATAFTFLGGGSAGGEAAMVVSGPTQKIAPMSRELSIPGGTCTQASSQLLIGLDGISMIGANQVAGGSLEKDARPACGDAITGGKKVTVAGCTVADGCVDNGNGTGTYTFGDWRDVLAVIYGGQNHAEFSGTRLNDDRTRNPARINCASSVRQALVNNWGTIFSDTGAPATCRTTTCAKLKHAFRFGDLSGTT